MLRFRHLLFLLYILSVNYILSAQNTLHISGYVSDSLSNEKLIGANIWLPQYNTGTSCNSFGYFSLRINKEHISVNVKISYTGYNTQSLNIEKDTVLNIRLTEGKTLQEVKVLAKSERIEHRNEVSTLSISAKDLEIMPAIMGERDVIKAYQFMPGVQSGTEGSSKLYVRGGSSDQNLVLLDDVTLYNINHLGGFVGVFNSDAINSSQLIKGGFPAQYGSRLSSVFDLRMKDGNNKKHEVAFTLGLMSTKLLLEGPIKKDKASYMFSVRRFMYDFLMMAATRFDSGDTWFAYTFYDLNLKLNYEINKRNHLYFSAYTGDDALKSRTNNKLASKTARYKNRWGNSLLAFRWNHLFNNNIFSNSTLSWTQYRFSLISKGQNNSAKQKSKSSSNQLSKIQDFSFKQDYEYHITDFYKIKFGFNGIWRENRPAEFKYFESFNNNTLIDTTYFDQRIKSIEAALYIENRFDFKNGIGGNIGCRFSNYFVSGNNFYSPEPRFIMHYLIANKFKISTSYARMKQYLHLLNGSSAGIRIDFWLPATKKVPPSISDQLTLGFAATFFRNIEFSIEGFYKEMSELILLKEGLSYNAINNDWESKVETGGKGKVYGTELLLQKKQGKHSGWISYTLSKNMREYKQLNNGIPFPYRYDRRHDFSIVYNWQISKNVDFSASWVFATGEALTFPNTVFDAPIMTADEIIYDNSTWKTVQSGTKNSMRGLPYHRLDIGLNFRKTKKRGVRTWNISIYNVYNRSNPYFYTWGTKTSGTGNNITTDIQVTGKSVFPIMPSVSYSFKF